MLRTSPIGEVLIELSEIDSTNNYAMRLINEGMAEHGMTIRADFQSKGKGQHGNIWLAEESKNLLCTVILDTKDFQIHEQFHLNMFACLSVADYLMTGLGLRNISIKWPNDIYADNRKIAGLLIENIIRGSNWTHAIIGIGLNVNQISFSELGAATSIILETGKANHVNHVLKGLLKLINHHFNKYIKGHEELLSTYNSMLYKHNQSILFTKNHETYQGIIAGVDLIGQLQIQVDGKIRTFKHKEIELIFN